jgi:hypothetical protein
MRALLTFMIAASLSSWSLAAVVSSTQHGTLTHDLDGQIAVGDLISGQIGAELAPLNGWHPANTAPADQLPALTDDVGALDGLTGLLNDFPGAGVAAKTLQYNLAGPTDIRAIQVLSGNAGGDGRIFSTFTVSTSTDNGSNFNLLGYFESDPLGTLNNSGSNPRYQSTLVRVSDDASPVLASGVTNLQFQFFAVDNTGGQYRDPYDGVNPYTGVDDLLSAAFVSPEIWEVDVVGVPEPATALLLVGGLVLISATRRRNAQ